MYSESLLEALAYRSTMSSAPEYPQKAQSILLLFVMSGFTPVVLPFSSSSLYSCKLRLQLRCVKLLFRSQH